MSDSTPKQPNESTANAPFAFNCSPPMVNSLKRLVSQKPQLRSYLSGNGDVTDITDLHTIISTGLARQRKTLLALDTLTDPDSADFQHRPEAIRSLVNNLRDGIADLELVDPILIDSLIRVQGMDEDLAEERDSQLLAEAKKRWRILG